MACLNCNNEFTPSKKDSRIKFCSADCRIQYRNKNKYGTKYYQKNKEAIRISRQLKSKERNAKRRERYKSDEQYREKQKSKTIDYNRRNPLTKKNHHLRKFGITLEGYNLLLTKQNGACAICGRNNSGDSQSKYFYVDHNHDTGEIRGLLCSQCNLGLGKFQDNPEILIKAANYLKGVR